MMVQVPVACITRHSQAHIFLQTLWHGGTPSASTTVGYSFTNECGLILRKSNAVKYPREELTLLLPC